MRPLPRWILPNRHRGEIVAKINGRRRILRLTLQALAFLEACYGDTDIRKLLAGFVENGIGAGDVQNILRAGLIGGADGSDDMPDEIEIEGGFVGALDIVTQLLERAFTDGSDIA